ncbi:MAG: 4-(cytidine 5'-diphospho)-2-C-methyl-D-erythritol kinase [Chloroflexi bacterium]|nr:4-(cytidine 5'-diphospho)-2-C-methyl-D-erythritol kinase [Chloroflexota bacterium]
MESHRPAGLILLAPAKLNLTLEVLGKRQDGYHEVRSVLQTIDLWDSLSMEDTHQGIDFHCSLPHLENRDNLVFRAVENMQASQAGRGVSIRLHKGIPEASGLGGGSSDAAAALIGLARLWETNLGMGDLARLAAQLSADAPFFLSEGTALAEGLGERITPVPSLPPHWAVVLMPHVQAPHPKTARLYASLSPEHYTSGEHTTRLVAALKGGVRSDLLDLLFNVFEGVAFKVYPGLAESWQRFERAGAPRVHLAGSGPALFTLTQNRETAAAISENLKGDGLEVYLARTRN